jgi:ribulose-phosphate 3-epimerase
VSWDDWIRGAEVEPSLYAADMSRLGEQVRLLLDGGVRVFHFDVGDGHFVEPITMGPIVLQWISPIVHERHGAIDVHLMVDNPAKHFAQFARAGGDSVTFHYEVVRDIEETVGAARELGLGVGIAFNPETEPEDVAAAVDGVDLVLCMSIHPGYSGQAFMPETYDRVRRLRELIPPEMHVQVDGGVGIANIEQLREVGVDLFVAGSSIFGADDIAAAYRSLVRAHR